MANWGFGGSGSGGWSNPMGGGMRGFGRSGGMRGFNSAPSELGGFGRTMPAFGNLAPGTTPASPTSNPFASSAGMVTPTSNPTLPSTPMHVAASGLRFPMSNYAGMQTAPAADGDFGMNTNQDAARAAIQAETQRRAALGATPQPNAPMQPGVPPGASGPITSGTGLGGLPTGSASIMQQQIDRLAGQFGQLPQGMDTAGIVAAQRAQGLNASQILSNLKNLYSQSGTLVPKVDGSGDGFYRPF